MAVYKENDLVRVAARENNIKRSYLLVNPLQGKHIPAKPENVLKVFNTVTQKIQEEIGENKKVLLIGFAETATAIGAEIAVHLQGEVWYIQTTREEAENADYLYFSEVHSHAVQQKIRREGLKECLSLVDWVIFVDDEVTTGNTIRNLIKKLKGESEKKHQYLIASLLNGMKPEIEDAFQKEEISCTYLLKTDNQKLEKQLENYKLNDRIKQVGLKESSHLSPDQEKNEVAEKVLQQKGVEVKQEEKNEEQISQKNFIQPKQQSDIIIKSRKQPRKLIYAKEYGQECHSLAEEIAEQAISSLNSMERKVRRNSSQGEKKQNSCHILVLGTEECMYEGILTADYIKQKYGADVWFHATTRSPICVSKEEGYPLTKRYELKSLYEIDRTTYVYNLTTYDYVVIVTDAQIPLRGTGYQTIQKALMEAGNQNIILARIVREE